MPDGQWLALDAETFRRGLARGAELVSRPAPPTAASDAADDVLDAQGAADLLGLSVSTVQRLARSGVLPCLPGTGRFRRFRRSALLNGRGATDCVSARQSHGID